MVSLLVEAATAHGSAAGAIPMMGLGLMLLVLSAVHIILGFCIGDCHSLVQKTRTTRCYPPCSNQGGMRILGVTTERQRYTYRIGAALASVVPGSRHQFPARRKF